jgi:hypothetical protein
MSEHEPTLLEVVERFLRRSPFVFRGLHYYCRHCAGSSDNDHALECPWLAVENTAKRERRRLDCKHDSGSDNTSWHSRMPKRLRLMSALWSHVYPGATIEEGCDCSICRTLRALRGIIFPAAAPLTAEPAHSPNTGHGHVRPRPDGIRARCGGPAMCCECAREQAQLAAQKQATSAKCVKCGGAKWVWGHELVVKSRSYQETGYDDQRYDCDACDGTGEAKEGE